MPLMIASLFISAIALLVVGLLLFLRKVGLATSQTTAQTTEMLEVEKR